MIENDEWDIKVDEFEDGGERRRRKGKGKGKEVGGVYVRTMKGENEIFPFG